MEGSKLNSTLSDNSSSLGVSVLQHKRVDSTMKYIQMLNLEDDEFEVTIATTTDEINKLGVAGWITYGEIAVNGIPMHFYKKPKRFSNI